MSNPVRVLQVEDDSGDAELLRQSLKRSPGSYEMHRANSLAQGIELAKTGDFAVILTDLGLPDAAGLKSVEQLHCACPGAALIVHSGNEDELVRVEVLARGANDFLSKHELSPVTLHRCIQQNLLRIGQREEIKRLLVTVNEKNAEVEFQSLQLAEKNKRLEALYDASLKFVNNVSHEFRTPLCVIKQYSSLIADELVGPINEEQRRMLRVMEDRVDDLNNMVDDLLDISRHETGLLAAKRELCQVSDILERLLPVLRQRASLRGIQVECQLPDDLPAVFCDPEKVSRTLINLIVNSIKFSAENDTVRVEVVHQRKNKEVYFAIHDNGPGIDAQQCEQIFQRFQQASTCLQSSTKGFGLGLNIAKELVDLNLGQISLSSVVGKGSTFSFTIPVDDLREITARYLSRLTTVASGNPYVTVLAIRLPNIDDADHQSTAEIHTFLNFMLRSNDLLLPTGPGSWYVMLNSSHEELEPFAERVQAEVVSINRNRPQGPLAKMEFQPVGEFHCQHDKSHLQALVCPKSESLLPSELLGLEHKTTHATGAEHA